MGNIHSPATLPRISGWAAWLLVLLSAPVAASAGPAETAFPGLVIEEEPPAKFGLGATPAEVIDVLGRPDVRTAEGLWIFYRTGASRANPDDRPWDTLVVRFEKNRVAAIKLTQGKILRERLAKRAPAAPGPS